MYDGNKVSERCHNSVCNDLGGSLFRAPHGCGRFEQNGVTTLSSAQLSRIFRAETKKWPNGKSIQLVLHRASNGEAITLQRLNKMSPQQWHTWVAEHKDSVVLVDSDDDVLKYVQSAPGAVGLVDVRSLNDHVNIVRVGGKVPMEDGYLPH